MAAEEVRRWRAATVCFEVEHGEVAFVSLVKKRNGEARKERKEALDPYL